MMKLQNTYLSGEPMTVEKYVNENLQPDTLSGKIEHLAMSVDNQRRALARLIDVLANRLPLTADEISEITLGYSDSVIIVDDE